MQGMSVIVKKTAQLMSGLIFVYGVYIITHGHLTPGGGFAGGALVAGAFILMILANGSAWIKLKKQEEGSSVVESIAVMMALLLGSGGLFAGSLVFFNNFLPAGVPGELLSAGTIPLYNILIGTEVAAALITIFLALVIYKEEISK
jgi:multisubunit Na+/H+ antiporter MnhB subunit